MVFVRLSSYFVFESPLLRSSSSFVLSQVPKVTHTEFCQGRTMRWALAWSFYDDVPVPVSFEHFLH